MLDAKSFQDFLFIARFPKGSLFLFLFLSFFNNLPGDVICNSAVYADDVTFNWKKDSAVDIWQCLEWVSELDIEACLLSFLST